MANKQTIWLVDIAVKDWIPGERHLAYVEVIATDELAARHKGYDEFNRLAKFSPAYKRKVALRKLSPVDWCAPSAIEIE